MDRVNLPLVSIALCTYNGAKYLSSQLDSLFSQSYPNFEVVAVDDCSTDDTFHILERYSARYGNLKIYRNDINIGFVKNFEKALMLCTGDLIALSDQDDVWNNQKISLQVEAIKDKMLIYHDSAFINEQGVSLNKKVSDIMNFYRGGRPEVFLFFNSVSGHSILMKKAVAIAATPFNPKFFHDWWLVYVATNLGEIDYLPDALVNYRQHPRNDTDILRSKKSKITRKGGREKLRNTFEWLQWCMLFDKNKDQSLINKFYYSYEARMNSRLSFGFSALLFKHREQLFKTRKRSSLNKFVFILNQVWGLKLKKLKT